MSTDSPSVSTALVLHSQVASAQDGGDMVPAPFNYDELDPEVAGQVRAALAKIRTAYRRMLGDIIAIGNELIAVKAKLGHGRFTHWLETEFPRDARTARRYTSVAEAFTGTTDIVSDLPLAVVYKLAEASPEIREPILKRIRGGSEISADIIDELLSTARSERQAAAATAKLSPAKRRLRAEQQALQLRAVEKAKEGSRRIEELAEAGVAVIRHKFAGDCAELHPYLDYPIWSRIGAKLASDPKPEKPLGNTLIDLQRLSNDGATDAVYGLQPDQHAMTLNGSQRAGADYDVTAHTDPIADTAAGS